MAINLESEFPDLNLKKEELQKIGRRALKKWYSDGKPKNEFSPYHWQSVEFLARTPIGYCDCRDVEELFNGIGIPEEIVAGEIRRLQDSKKNREMVFEMVLEYFSYLSPAVSSLVNPKKEEIKSQEHRKVTYTIIYLPGFSEHPENIEGS